MKKRTITKLGIFGSGVALGAWLGALPFGAALGLVGVVIYQGATRKS